MLLTQIRAGEYLFTVARAGAHQCTSQANITWNEIAHCDNENERVYKATVKLSILELLTVEWEWHSSNNTRLLHTFAIRLSICGKACRDRTEHLNIILFDDYATEIPRNYAKFRRTPRNSTKFPKAILLTIKLLRIVALWSHFNNFFHFIFNHF